ncbi:c6 zinc finger domain-containing protein [Thozetella sp. PMI_491]|nr:c6 zinc finger domain-containing protein [Thozetella sp. PMI_491]
MSILDDARIEEVLGLPDANLSIYDDLLGLPPAQNEAPFSMPQHGEDVGKGSNEIVVASVQYLLEDLRPKSLYLPPRAVLACSIPWVGTGGSSYVVHRSLQIPLSERTSSLTRLPKSDPVAQNSARMILQVMRAYPYMMLRRETFPPFIHPHWHRQGASVLPRPLASCMSIASLFASRTSETSAFLWEAVMRESQKCVDEMKTFSDYDLLAAIQAHIIYIIMRFVDGSSQPADMNMQLVISHKVLCNIFVDRYSDTAGQYQSPLAYSNWEEWIYAESKVRTVVVFFLISRIVSVYTSAWCSATARFNELPLCSAKGVWEAKTAPTWASEHTAYTHAPGATLLTVGELIEAQEMSDDPIRANALDAWNARADSLGTLLNIATMNLMKI